MLRPINNPPNPYQSTDVDWEGEPPAVTLALHEETARSILSSNESPDLGFKWSLNPYRGCYHGCTYCYARPFHQYLDWGAGTDFERKLVIKTNAPTLLRKHLDKPSWQGERIMFSGITDCYQPLEAAYQLTRQCLEVCLEFGNPVSVITKGASVIRRDAALLAELSKRTGATVFLSIPFIDDDTGRIFEPFASLISKRFATLELLSAAGVNTGVALAPIIPGVNDDMIPQIIKRAHQAGAKQAFMTLLRLAEPVRQVFLSKLKTDMPLRYTKVVNALRDTRDGKLNDSRFGSRLKGQGQRWEAIAALFESQCKLLGLQTHVLETPSPTTTFQRPQAQLRLL